MMHVREELAKKNITLHKYSPHDGDHVRTSHLVECFRSVFADRPWHEWLKCSNPQCSQYWGVKDHAVLAKQKFLHCDVPVIDYWPRAKVMEDLSKEITADALCTLAIRGNDEVVGFCWGYPISIEALEEKLEIQFRENLEKAFGPHSHVGYQDEVGVIPACRGDKIAKVMNFERIRDLSSRGLHVTISRARRAPEPSVTFLWYTQKLGYQVLREYPGDDGRVILGSRLDDVMGRL